MLYYTLNFKRQTIRNKAKTFSEFKSILNNPTDSTKVNLRDVDTHISVKPYLEDPEKDLKTRFMVELRQELNDLNKHYKEDKINHFEIFEIPKATGGFRTIKAPDRALSEQYSHIRNNIRYRLKALSHNNAYAYIQKRSITDAIKRHQANESMWFLKIDISKFFDHCSEELIVNQLSKIYPFSLDIDFVKQLAEFAVLNNELPQGTPLSPDLTNWLMVPFDYHFSKWCEQQCFVYTRYADDMIISHKNSFKFRTVIEKIQDIFQNYDYPFQIKEEKTRYGSRSGSNWNLGLMLNKDNQITLGHEYKKTLKVILHKVKNGQLPKNDPSIIGLFSYLKQIEPQYYELLSLYAMRKYGGSINWIINPKL